MSPRQRTRTPSPGVLPGERRLGLRAAVMAVVTLGALGSCTTRRVTEVEIRAVSIVPVAPAVAEGSSVQLNATVSDDLGTPISQAVVVWSSDADSIATVDAEGRVTGRRSGTTTIRATFRGVSGAASITVDPGPSIVVTPDSVELFGTQGSSPRADVLVENGGVGTLTGLQAAVEYEGGATGWLPLSIGPTAPSTLTMTAATGGLPVGAYRAVVTVTANAGNSPLALPVSLVVTEHEPIIVVDPASLGFEGTAGRSGTPPAVVTVTNGGGGSLTGLSASVWYGGASAGWLSASLAADSAPTQLTVNVDAITLPPGTHHGEVRIASSVAVNDPQPVPVTFVVEPPPEAADVSITVSGPAGATSGDRIDYVLTVRNAGPDTAKSVVATAQTPTGASFVSSTAGTHASGVLTWPAGALAPGAARSNTVRLEIGTATTGALVYAASVTSTTADPSVGNNQSQVTTTVTEAPKADLVVGASAPATAAANTDMTLHVTVQNGGPAAATSVVLRATLPTGVSFRSATGGGSHAGGVVTWSVGTLSAGGAARSFDVVVRPSSNTSGNVTHTVSATAATQDPTPGNSTASATTFVLASNQADVVVTIDGPAVATPGALVRYDITVSNEGPARADNVDVSFRIPDQTSFVLTTRGKLSNGTVTWSHGRINKGASYATSVYLRLSLGAAGSIASTVVATSDDDPYVANNSATKTTSVN